MYSAFRCDRPAVRSVAMSFVRISEGVGNVFVELKRVMKRDFMDAAAAEETCWEIMPEQREWKGLTGSERPGGEKRVQG